MLVAAFPPLPTLDPAEIALGKDVYALNCASCHGVNLEGESNWMTQNNDGSFRAPPHDVSGHTWHHADSLLIESIVLGGERFAGAHHDFLLGQFVFQSAGIERDQPIALFDRLSLGDYL